MSNYRFGQNSIVLQRSVQVVHMERMEQKPQAKANVKMNGTKKQTKEIKKVLE